MVKPVQYVTPYLHVWLEDGDAWELQTNIRDILRWETTARKRGWPQDPDQAGRFFWCTFLAWAASVRTERLSSDVTLEQFQERVESVVPEAVTVDPTLPVPGAV